jgi:hypothetical protein
MALERVVVVIGGGPVVRELLAGGDAAKGDKHDLALDADVGVAGVIAEDHGAFALGSVERSYIKVVGDLDFGWTEHRGDFA